MQQEEVIVAEEHGHFVVSLSLIHPSANKENFSFSCDKLAGLSY